MDWVRGRVGCTDQNFSCVSVGVNNALDPVHAANGAHGIYLSLSSAPLLSSLPGPILNARSAANITSADG